MDTKYNHKDFEEKIYRLWEKNNSFKPKGKGKPFSIILPPPNANAALHYGHAMYTVEDVLTRFHRMLGDNTLWLPGADHAGFETQVVYEKHLEKEGKSRFDFSRDALYQNIWDFVMANRSTMENQLKKLGFSLDWSRRKFTLDPDIVKIVYKTFKKLADDGLVYRDYRLVNYCTKHGTAFSDLEVEHLEKEDYLYYIEFPFKGKGKGLIVATVRPETIFGDVAVAVNPKDKRYQKYIGKTLTNPLNGRDLLIIADPYVKKDFGTGALKITPAHDENDFSLAKKFNLPLIQVIDFNGRMNSEAGDLRGLKVIAARERVLEILKEKGLFKKQEKYTHTVGTCYKCGNTLEPLPLPQWYIKTEKLAQPAIAAVKNKKINIIPKKFEKVYFNWLKNIHDWNISRQVVWGIRIPAWECQECKSWIITDGETPKKCSECKSHNLIQDKDTFDTWFSSGQWPVATLKTTRVKDFEKYYPTSVMETGYDILFFWVARMIILGLYITGKVPFQNVYLHGIVRDSKGQKMSKSKGNVINPLEVVEKYGADSLRMSLISGAGPGNDQNYSETKIIGYRNFANKLWNASRFVSSFNGEAPNNKEFDIKIKEVVKLVTKNIENYKLNIAAEKVYANFWHNFCDKQIEEAKKGKIGSSQLKEGLLTYLKLIHPFMPFITESVYQNIYAKSSKDLLITSSWPR